MTNNTLWNLTNDHNHVIHDRQCNLESRITYGPYANNRFNQINPEVNSLVNVRYSS